MAYGYAVNSNRREYTGDPRIPRRSLPYPTRYSRDGESGSRDTRDETSQQVKQITTTASISDLKSIQSVRFHFGSKLYECPRRQNCNCLFFL